MAIRVETHAEPIPGYKLLERLGGGGFGEVWKAEAPGGLLKAIKIVHGDIETAGDESQKADQELKALRRVITVRHPYILSLERFDIVDGRLLIVMELADRNLADRAKECRTQGMRGIPRDELLLYMKETAEALDLMNSDYQLQHLDVKPQNLFLVHNHIKVADFGLVKDLQDRMAATITGGVTPVYAAPETFDGWVSRFCDQYSLAIVYQELLTGQRPFNANNVHQLVMQHVQGKPNLDSLPPEDRDQIARALAKNPDDRFPTCMELVNALQRREPAATSSPERRSSVRTVPPSPTAEPANEPASTTTLAPPPRYKSQTTSPTAAGSSDADNGQHAARPHVPKPVAAAPTHNVQLNPDGDLVPALVIGLGHLGLVALNEMSSQIRARFGSTDALPQVRLLGIDTDSYSLFKGNQGADNHDSALHRRDTVIAKLNRAGHYLNPRNGRTRIDSWFDINMLFRIRREPVSAGTRALGRLALFGNYRSIRARLESELTAVMDANQWEAAARRTGLSIRSTEPRVFIITSLAGGTGSGMLIDLAYLIRDRFQELGHDNAEVTGVFLLPAVEPTSAGTLPLGNTYAALTELNHFSTVERTGLQPFTARYDEHEKATTATMPPFTRCVFLPASAGGKDLETPARIAGEGIAHELTTPIGVKSERARTASDSLRSSTFGLYRYAWPRHTVLHGASQRLCAEIVQRWLAKDGGKARQEQIATLVGEKWTQNELGADVLITRFQEACAKVIGKDTDAALQAILEPLVRKKAHLTVGDRETLVEAITAIDDILGLPTDSSVLHRPGVIDDALRTQTEVLTTEWQQKLEHFTVSLFENPDYRIAGAEEALRQCVRLIEQALSHHEPLCQELTRNALKSNERLRFLVANFAGIFQGRRSEQLLKELHDLLIAYPKARFQSLIIRRVIYTYTGLRGFLSDQVRELGFYRMRLNELAAALQAPITSDVNSLVSNGEVVLPVGCHSLNDAVKQLSAPCDARGTG